MPHQDREAYPDNEHLLPDPPESPWRSRMHSHKAKNTSFFQRTFTYVSFLLLALPLLLLFNHVHGWRPNDGSTADELLVQPLADYPVSVSANVSEAEGQVKDVHESSIQPSVHVEPIAMIEPHPLTFALIMFSRDSASEGTLLLKSILMYSSAPVHLHIICDEDAREYLEDRLALVTQPRHNVHVRFYPMSQDKMLARIHREGAITTDHSAGVPGLMKLFIHEILPDTVKKTIFLDTDAFFISDPVLLWNRFDDFGPEAALSMPTHFDQSAPEWHNANRICSCVMLLDLEKLRKLRLMDSSEYRKNPEGTPALSPPAFTAMFGPPGKSGHYEGVKLGDQGYWWAIVSHRPEILQHLHFDYEVSSCLVEMYGTQLGDDGANESSAKKTQVHVWDTVHQDDIILPKVLHFNCLDGTPRFFEWEGWSDPKNPLTRTWGPAVSYHSGYKWLWLNQGQKDVQTMTVETIRAILFGDEQYGRTLSSS